MKTTTLALRKPWGRVRAKVALYDAHAESGSEVGSEADEALRDELRVSPVSPE
jgi:hypothetical protein